MDGTSTVKSPPPPPPDSHDGSPSRLKPSLLSMRSSKSERDSLCLVGHPALYLAPISSEAECIEWYVNPDSRTKDDELHEEWPGVREKQTPELVLPWRVESLLPPRLHNLLAVAIAAPVVRAMRTVLHGNTDWGLATTTACVY